VVIRGTASAAEWVSNFTLGGFELAESNLHTNLVHYLRKYGLEDPARNIYLITGHSRGGTVANLLAARLNNNDQRQFTQNLFAYTFATPNSTWSGATTRANHQNIFNILNTRDSIVTNFPPFQNRYGIDLAITMPNGLFPRQPHPAHRIETYVLWMSNNPNLTYPIFRSMIAEERSRGWLPRLLTFNSPVDISVYDINGHIAAQIINNVAINTNNCDAHAFVVDDIKHVFLPYGTSYTVRLSATGHGTMTYIVEIVDILSDTPHSSTTFNNVMLYPGRQMTSEITGDPNVRLFAVNYGINIAEITQNGTEISLATPTPPPIPTPQPTLLPRDTHPNAINIIVNGQLIHFPDQQPIIVDGRVLVPVRGVFEHMGFDVHWHPDTRVADLIGDNIRIAIRADTTIFRANGLTITPDVPQRIVNGRLLLPLRAIAEAAGGMAEWDSATRTAIIMTG